MNPIMTSIFINVQKIKYGQFPRPENYVIGQSRIKCKFRSKIVNIYEKYIYMRNYSEYIIGYRNFCMKNVISNLRKQNIGIPTIKMQPN